MTTTLKQKFEYLITGDSPQKLAMSVAVGIGLAFSPYLGIQTFILFLIGWLFKLNNKVMLFVLYLVSNPWTMFPIVVLDYMVGLWITKTLLGIDILQYNPVWMISFNRWLDKKMGVYIRKYIAVGDLSFWAYFIGGHVVAIGAALIAYPLAKRYFERKLGSKPDHEKFR